MVRKNYYFISPRPKVAIEYSRGTTRNNTYHRAGYKITSLYRLTKEQITKLWDAGMLGSGQSWGISSQCDGKEEPAGQDTVPCTVIDENGNVLDEVAVDYRGVPYGPEPVPYYVYHTYFVCDSGD